MNKPSNASASLRASLASLAIAAMLGCIFAATSASATTLSFSGTSSDGHPVSGTADFTLGAGTATIKLTNTTTTTLDAGELFTGLDFSLAGLTPSLTSKTGIERTVTGSGSFSDTGSAQNLTWSLVSLGSGSFQLNFNPNADDAILGPPSGGNYAGANGSIKGNAGHNPFAAEVGTFVLSVPGLTSGSSVSVKNFRYGTTLDPATGTTTGGGPDVPEPSTLVLMVLGLALTAIRRLR
jgi:PEP-CTERM motif